MLHIVEIARVLPRARSLSNERPLDKPTNARARVSVELFPPCNSILSSGLWCTAQLIPLHRASIGANVHFNLI